MTDYHWTPALQRRFLEALSETGSVQTACKDVSMSRRAAYNLRNRYEGRAFSIGWDAANFIARAAVADTLMDMVLHGQKTTIIREEDGCSMRKFHSPHLSMALLTRLDRQAEAVRSGDHADITHQVARNFEYFLDFLEHESCDETLAQFGIEPVLQVETQTTALVDADDDTEIQPQIHPQIQCELAEISAVFSSNDPEAIVPALEAIEAKLAIALAEKAEEIGKNEASDKAIEQTTEITTNLHAIGDESSCLVDQLENAATYHARQDDTYFESISAEQALNDLDMLGQDAA
jgi:hypothetical protein